jgi:thioredoxin-like negative regulator of GroEL
LENDESEKLTNETAPTKTVAQESENTSLTESFARVMIKNGNYRKALQIITELSLNNPEKSIYFADQIRFLKKLIINENN